MTLAPELEAIEARARDLYGRVQDAELPGRFRRPEEFSVTKTQPMQGDVPKKVPVAYRTSSSDYGSSQPSIVEMPSQWSGKRDTLVRQQNYVVYRAEGLNCELDKAKYMDEFVTIRRK